MLMQKSLFKYNKKEESLCSISLNTSLSLTLR